MGTKVFNIASLDDRSVTVLGAQRSGIAAAKLLNRHGAKVLLSDLAPNAVQDNVRSVLEEQGVEVELGAHSDRVYEATLVVVSPGIPSTAPVLEGMKQRNIPVISEVELASWFVDAPVIAVTGSNGKTTTCTLISKLLDTEFYHPILCGNIGNPFADAIPELTEQSPDDIYVVEVSSFQLEHVPSFHPSVSVILNVTPDHLDRYAQFDDYVQAKLNITANQTKNNIFVYNMDDPVLVDTETQAERIGFSLIPEHSHAPFTWDGSHILWENEALIAFDDCGLRGKHNLANILAALNSIHKFIQQDQIEVFRNHLIETLQAFTGIEHRMEFVKTVKGVSYYNDSKATNIDSVKYAIESFDQPIFLILGGYDKDGDFTQLIPGIRDHVKETIIIGKDRFRIQSMLEPDVAVRLMNDLVEAVEFASSNADEGDVVLLSPACASFDQYNNYEERGEHFKTLVSRLHS